eukprot:g18565.t1
MNRFLLKRMPKAADWLEGQSQEDPTAHVCQREPLLMADHTFPGNELIKQDEANFNKGASKMFTFFFNRGFPSTVVDRALNQVRPVSRTSAPTPSLSSRNSNRVPLVLTYHPTSIHIQK